MNPELIGPFRPAAYLTAYAYIALPNAFLATALQFALALRSGRPMAAYLGSLLLVFMGFFVASILLFRRGLGTLLDPIGIRFIVEDIAHLWTSIEKQTRLLALDGIVLTNRLFWLGIGVLVLAAAYLGSASRTGWSARGGCDAGGGSPRQRGSASARVRPCRCRRCGARSARGRACARRCRWRARRSVHRR